MFARALGLVTVIGLCCPTASLADELARAEVPQRQPWIAAGLTLVPGLDLYLVTMLTHTQLANAAIPALLGAGHWYGGDPVRGAAVSACGYGAIGLGAAGGLAFGLAFPGGQAETLGCVLNGGALGLLAFAGLASYDAYETTERRNRSM